jgi:hypothetical protein
MPRSRPGLLAVWLALPIGLSVLRALVGRLTRIWLLLSVGLLRRVRRLTLLPLERLVLAIRIPWRMLAHDTLPLQGTQQGHQRCAESTDPTQSRYRLEASGRSDTAAAEIRLFEHGLISSRALTLKPKVSGVGRKFLPDARTISAYVDMSPSLSAMPR